MQFFGAVTKNYIEITGTASNHIEITNSMFLKSPDESYFIVADPWNSNEVPRTMTLGCYHYNWTSFWDDSSVSVVSSNKLINRTFGLYPNPITKILTVKLSDIKEDDVVQICNIMGQIIKEVNT